MMAASASSLGMNTKFDSDAIRQTRRQLGLSQTQLSVRLGCTVETIRNWENQRSTPSGFHVERIRALCLAQGVAPPLLYPGAGEGIVAAKPAGYGKSQANTAAWLPQASETEVLRHKRYVGGDSAPDPVQ